MSLALEPCVFDSGVGGSARDHIHCLAAIGGELGCVGGHACYRWRQQSLHRLPRQRGVKPDECRCAAASSATRATVWRQARRASPSRPVLRRVFLECVERVQCAPSQARWWVQGSEDGSRAENLTLAVRNTVRASWISASERIRSARVEVQSGALRRHPFGQLNDILGLHRRTCRRDHRGSGARQAQRNRLPEAQRVLRWSR